MKHSLKPNKKKKLKKNIRLWWNNL